jgi:hypothetical protein
MDKEKELMIKVETLEQTIDFWNEKFDYWHDKLKSCHPGSDDMHIYALNMNECWERMEYEKVNAANLYKEISKYT